MKRKTTEEFIEDAIKIHGNKYDYSLVDYTFSKDKITIICPIHGNFEQKPNNHLQGQGCKKCGDIIIRDKQVKDLNLFINQANKIHNSKFDYSIVEYKNCKTKIKIICPVHGEFEQIPLHHLKGSGCYKCNGGYQLTTNDFINKSNLVHNYKYDYSKSIYTKAREKLKIICPIHGEFEQDAYSHTIGCGCPKCNGGTNLTYTNDNKFLYLFKDLDKSLIKIGISHNPKKRLRVISKNSNIILLKQYEKTSYLEKVLHIRYKSQKVVHILCEDGKNEWFNLNDKNIKDIDRYIKLLNIVD